MNSKQMTIKEKLANLLLIIILITIIPLIGYLFGLFSKFFMLGYNIWTV